MKRGDRPGLGPGTAGSWGDEKEQLWGSEAGQCLIPETKGTSTAKGSDEALRTED